MEQWQHEYITAKRLVLIEYTICNTDLLTILRSKGVLGKNDVDQLDTIRNSTGHLAQTNLMYDIIATRVGSYDVIIQALHETNQTGARNVLMDGYVLQGILPPFGFADEIFEWNSAHFSPYDEILSKVVKIQSKEVLLADFCSKIDSEKLKDIMKRTIDKKQAFEILSSKWDFVLIKNTIPEKIKYYIPRTLTKRARLNESILRDNEQDIFVVKGATWIQLTKMTSPNIVDRSSNQLERLTVRHILCELDEDFETICTTATSCSKDASVHLLNFESGTLEWVLTHGSIDGLHGYVHEIQDKLSDDMLIENLKRCKPPARYAPVCISDTPGMGKTILLAKIANEINNASGENTLVFFFVLREFVQHLPTKVKDITADKIKELISTQVSTTNFGKQIVQHLLNSPDQNIEICFDGFDEILETQIETTKRLLKVIRFEFNNTRLHVTTRPHMRQLLEETLCVLGHNILPFEDGDQINFLVNFWKFTVQLSSSSERTAMLENFAQRCLSTLKEKMVEDERDIAGVPLQCRLLGEIYQKQVKRMLSAPISDDDTDNVPLVNSIYQMYCNLMLLRFERAEEQQRIRDNAYFGMGKLLRVMTNRKSWVVKVKQVHYIIAIDVLFPELTNTVKIVLPMDHHKYMHMYSREMYSLGLIDAKVTFDKNYRFSHRTFAEFLVAEFLVNVITSKYQFSRKDEFWTFFLGFFFRTILKTKTKLDVMLDRGVSGVDSRVKITIFDNSVIAYFINAHLKKYVVTSWDVEGTYNYLKYVNFPDFIFHDIFIACAASNFEYLFNFLMIIYKTIKQYEFSLPAELLITAAKYSGLELNQAIHNIFTDKNTVNSEHLVTPSQTVVQRGNQPVLQVLLNKYNTKCISKNLLHVCLTGSHYDSIDTIFRKLEIIKLLLEKAPNLCNEKLEEDGTTPLLQPFAHLELIQCLLENGADANAVSKNQENVLHIFLRGSEKCKIEEHVLIDLLKLLKKFKFTDYNRVSVKGEIPLSLALRSIFLTADSLQLFKAHGTDFTFINKSNENLLYTAISNQQSVECLQILKDFGSKAKAVNLNCETLLYIASDIGHKKAVEFLIKEANDSVNVPDANGNTPLHVAFTKDARVPLQIQDLLIENGANINVLNSGGSTPIAYWLEHSINLEINVERLKALEARGYKISADNADKLLRAILLNQSASSWEFNEELCTLISFLLSVGGRVKCDNGDNPADVKSIKLCLLKICQNVYSSMFTEPPPPEPLEAFQQIGDKILDENNAKFFSVNKFNFQNVNIESIMFILLYLKDKKSFRTLQKSYQLLLSRSTRFVAPFEDLLNFLEQVDQHIFVIFTDYIILSIAAVQDTIDLSILVVDSTQFEHIFVDQDSPVVVIVSEAAILSFLQRYKNTTRKIICITKCNNPVELPKHLGTVVSFKDEYKWESLAPAFQNQLLQRFKNHKSFDTQLLLTYNCQKLFLPDLMASSELFPTDFLIPKHLTTSFRGLFDVDAITKSSVFYDTLQQYVVKQFFPHLKYTSTLLHDNLKVSDKLKELPQHGPTASFLAAMWILRNLNEIFESGEDFFDQLFSFYEVNVTVMNPETGTNMTVKTYEFQHWLLLYFMEKLTALSSSQKLIKLKSGHYEILLHCCINLHAPNLLQLFDHKFYLSQDALLVAATFGNVYLFDKDNTTTEHSMALNNEAIWTTNVKFQQIHLFDILYFFKCTENQLNCENLYRNTIFCFGDNSYDDETEIMQRKLLVLNYVIRDGVMSTEDLLLTTRHMNKAHPEILKFLLKRLDKLSPDAILPEQFIHNVSLYLTAAQFGEIIKFILEHGFSCRFPWGERATRLH